MDTERVMKWLRDGGEYQAADILSQCRLEFKYIDTAFPLGSDEPVDICNAIIYCPRKIYSERNGRLEEVTKQITESIHQCGEGVGQGINDVRWLADPDLPAGAVDTAISSVDAAALIGKIESITQLMIAYVTGGREEGQSSQYHEECVQSEVVLDAFGLGNPNPHRSLESFWEHCKKSNLSTYASRRAYVKDLYSDLLVALEKAKKTNRIFRNWERTNKNLDKLEPVREQWAKARRYISGPNADYENAIKEAINSIESAVRLFSGDRKATLGQGIKQLPIDNDVSQLISKVYGLISNRHSVRHGGTQASGLGQEEAEFFLEFAAICINYLKQRMEKKETE